MSLEDSYFSRMLRGEIPPPPVATLLGGRIDSVNREDGILRARYQAEAAFCNPAGQVQGGMLCAMLDDLCAAMVDATVMPDEAVATLNLNTSFLRPAEVGELVGEATMIRRGREICYVSATLRQQGKEVAAATATCKVVSLRQG